MTHESAAQLRRCCVVLAFVWLIAPASANDILSIEAQAMLNEFVAVVTVEGITEDQLPRVTLKVTETMRGPADRQTLVLEWPANVARPAVGQELLVFASDAGETTVATAALPLDGSIAVFDVSLQLRRHREELLSAVREVGETGAPLIRVPVPDPRQIDDTLAFMLPTRTPAPASLTSVLLPKLRSVELLARRWLASDEPSYRRTGATILSNFRNPRNVTLLSGLLGDTAFERALPGRWKTGTYVVRQAAYAALRQWNADVKPPAMEGPVLFHRPLRWTTGMTLTAGGALVLLVLISTALVLRRRAGGMPRVGYAGAIFSATLILLAVGTCFMWWRSWRLVDEIVFGINGTHHQIASYHGGIQYTTLSNWTGDHRLLYGQFCPIRHVKPPGNLMGSVGNKWYHTASGAWRPWRESFLTFEEPDDDRWSMAHLTPEWSRSRLGVTSAGGTETLGSAKVAYRIIRIPLWPLTMPGVALPIVAMVRAHRRRRRLGQGRCPSCRYDLRATPDSCPECGWNRMRTGRDAPAAAPHSV